MTTNHMRILMIAPTPFFADRGCHVHIAEQAQALTRRGHKVLIATYGNGRDLPGITTIRCWRIPWFSAHTIGPSWHKFYLDILLLWTSIRAAFAHEPDVIHGHLHEGVAIGWVVSRLLGIPLVFDCQGSLTGELIAHRFILARSALLQRIWYSIERWLDRRPDRILAQSTTMRAELMNRFGIDQKDIVIAFDGVNTDVFVPGKPDLSLRLQLGIPPNANVIVFLGLLTPYQGIDDLLAAFPIIQSHVPNAHLLVMGYPNVKQYKIRAQKLGIANAIHFTGAVRYEDAPRYLLLGDVAVSAKRSQTEANGKIYNYMACGLPTVVLDTGVNRNILGDLGVYVSSPKRPAELAKAVVSLLSDPAKRAALAVKVRDVAVALYSWDAVANRIERAYAEVYIPWQLRVFAVSIRKKEKWRWAQPRLAKYVRNNMRCLDVGAGVGTLSVLQQRVGGQWEFTETDDDAARQTEVITNTSVHRVSIDDPILPASHFDLITAFDVIEHVSDPIAFLVRTYELLKPQGMLILTTPAAADSFYLLRRVADWIFGIDMDAHGHEVEGFSRQQLMSMAQTAGFTVTAVNAFSFFWTELIELAYNGMYIIKNKKRQRTRGYNLSLSPASAGDVRRHTRQLYLLHLAYPLLRGISLLDRVIPLSSGYEYGIILKKQ